MLPLAPPTNRKLFVVYHICMISNWKQIVEEQCKVLVSSGLAQACQNIYVTLVGTPEWEIPKAIADKVQIKYRSTDTKVYEREAIRVMQKEFVGNTTDYVLYLHSQGVSKGGSETVADWRRYMEYFLIEKYPKCLAKLEQGYDTCGVNWTTAPRNHYSGNFWWVTCQYLQKLIDVAPTPDYLGPEMWLCTKNPRAWSMQNSGISHYIHPYPRAMYVDKF